MMIFRTSPGGKCEFPGGVSCYIPQVVVISNGDEFILDHTKALNPRHWAPKGFKFGMTSELRSYPFCLVQTFSYVLPTPRNWIWIGNLPTEIQEAQLPECSVPTHQATKNLSQPLGSMKQEFKLDMFPNPYHPCMVYLPTFTIKIDQM